LRVAAEARGHLPGRLGGDEQDCHTTGGEIFSKVKGRHRAHAVIEYGRGGPANDQAARFIRARRGPDDLAPEAGEQPAEAMSGEIVVFDNEDAGAAEAGEGVCGTAEGSFMSSGGWYPGPAGGFPPCSVASRRSACRALCAFRVHLHAGFILACRRGISMSKRPQTSGGG
jgi:hypothetical protein